MRTKLRLERLELREVPATLADTLPYYVEGFNPVPGADPHQVLVTSAFLADGTGVDVFAATGEGMGPRVVVRDFTTGKTVSDVLVFAPDFRGGVESVTAIGSALYATPGGGGGPVVARIDLGTFAVDYFTVPGFADDWRGGLKLTVADVDFPNGFTEAHSPEPENELLVMGASAGGGPVVSFLNADGTQAIPSVFAAAPDDRREWEFVPAGAGVTLPGGKFGFLAQPVGQEIDQFGHVAETNAVPFDGSEFAPHDHEFPFEYEFDPILV